MLRTITRFILIGGLSLAISGCGSGRKLFGGAEEGTGGTLTLKNGKDVIDNNISGRDLFIEKFRVNYEAEDASATFSGFLRKNREGDILVSTRTFAGIEVLRILVDSDSIKAYDRINRTLYVQGTDYITGKTGLDRETLPLLWGDLPEFGKASAVKKGNNGNGIMSVKYRGTDYRFTVSGEERKLVGAEASRGGSRIYDIGYSEFKEEDGIIYPSRIVLRYYVKNVNIAYTLGGVSNEPGGELRFRIPAGVTREIMR